MATSYKIEIDPGHRGLLGNKSDGAAAAKVSELLQKDLENHHVFFTAKGYHNHMAHHLLTIYGTGGNSEALQNAFDIDSSFQAATVKPHTEVLQELQSNWSSAHKYLGNVNYYPDFLSFFQGEVEKKGWQQVVLDHLLGDTESAQELFSRSWSSFAHSMIQLLYGLEWEQPAIIAEALAQAAIHDNYVGTFLYKVEKAAAADPSKMSLTLPELLEQVHSDEDFVNSVRHKNPNAMLDGVEVFCPDEAIAYLSRVRIDPDDMEERVAENIHTAAYMASASIFHPPHLPRYDFFLIHHLTLAPILLLLGPATWIPEKVKHRILEWKGRFDILQYVARWCPPLQIESVADYKPHDTFLGSSTEELLPRFHGKPDDGHVVKVARALVIAQRNSQKYRHRPWIRIKDDATWLKALYVLLDSTIMVHSGFPWVRSAGWDEAWEDSGYPKSVLNLA
ncbi:hypothetical protein LX32DRAFT_627118 [Colletotrichum zoysiae]|uniref:HypA protein n=1 Tax=Colletotrichum zoysiae TaxID=1216348 RepID=A0AAD9H9B1_9PEZI|nr:hypothetical protein LX32DRAFT_627118 [Colletotrichum zoysiae]